MSAPPTSSKIHQVAICISQDKKKLGETTRTMSGSFFAIIVLGIMLLNLSGCANPGWLEKRSSMQGATELIDPDSFEEIDLAFLLSPNIDDVSDKSRTWIDEETGEKINEELPIEIRSRRLEEAFEGFDKHFKDKTKEEGLLARNRIQDRIIAASNQRCGSYKQYLKKFDSEANLLLGAATTAVAGAGAIFTPANTVRALSGIAAILSGVRAEVNESYFQSQTVQVLTRGFEKKREALYKRIKDEREPRLNPEEKSSPKKSATLTEYTVREAIGDAIVYHDHCSVVAGLEEVAIAIERVDDPGVKRMKGFFDDFGKARQALDEASGKKATSEKSQKIRGEIKEIEKSINRTESEIVKKKAEFAEAKSVEKASKSDLDNATDDFDDKQDALRQVKKSLENSQQEKEKVEENGKNKIANLRTKIMELQENLKTSNERREEKEKNLAVATSERIHIVGDVGKRKKEAGENYKTTKQKLVVDKNMGREERVEKTEVAYKELNDFFNLEDAKIKSQDAEIQRLEDELAEVKNEISTFTTDLIIKKTEIEKSENELKTQLNKVNKAEKKVEDSTKDANKAEIKLVRAEEKQDAAQKLLQERQNTLNDLQVSLDELKAQHSEKKVLSAKTKDSLNPTIMAPNDDTFSTNNATGLPKTDERIKGFLKRVQAVDALGADISSGVENNAPDTFEVAETPVTFHVTDSAKRAAVKVATVKVVLDTEKPKIELNGEKEITLTVGDGYKEEKATATDNFDDDSELTKKINTDATLVNVNTSGEYTVKYTVSDSAGNEADPVTRKVIVKEKPEEGGAPPPSEEK